MWTNLQYKPAALARVRALQHCLHYVVRVRVLQQSWQAWREKQLVDEDLALVASPQRALLNNVGAVLVHGKGYEVATHFPAQRGSKGHLSFHIIRGAWRCALHSKTKH